MTLALLLHPERASRLVQQKALDQSNIGLAEVLDATIAATVNRAHKDAYIKEVQNNVNFRVLFHLMNLAAHKEVHAQVNAIAYEKLNALKSSLLANQKNAIGKEMVRRINDFKEHPDRFEVIPSPKLPDGSPIGMDCFH